MIQKTIYFRTQEDLDLFNEIDNKAGWLHEHLVGGSESETPRAEQGQRNAPIVIENLGTGKKTEVAPILTFVDEPEEEKYPYPHYYAIDRSTGHPVNTQTQEYIEEPTPEMVEWLKKKGKYVG